jgi:hypothetical protein
MEKTSARLVPISSSSLSIADQSRGICHAKKKNSA